jgi:hypothetical protein
VAIKAKPHLIANTQRIYNNISLNVKQKVLRVETTQKEPKRQQVKSKNLKLRLLKAKSLIVIEN